jgi:hypothetical protein
MLSFPNRGSVAGTLYKKGTHSSTSQTDPKQRTVLLRESICIWCMKRRLRLDLIPPRSLARWVLRTPHTGPNMSRKRRDVTRQAGLLDTGDLTRKSIWKQGIISYARNPLQGSSFLLPFVFSSFHRFPEGKILSTGGHCFSLFLGSERIPNGHRPLFFPCRKANLTLSISKEDAGEFGPRVLFCVDVFSNCPGRYEGNA